MKKYLLLIVSLFLFFILPMRGEEISADSLKMSADQCMQTCRYIEALDLYMRGMERAKIEGNERTLLACVGNIGNVHAHFKDYELALHYYTMCYENAVKSGIKDMESKSIHNIQACYCLLGQPGEAKKYLKLQAQQPLEDKNLARYYLLIHQAMIAQAEGNLRSALTLNEEALELCRTRKLGQQYEMATLGAMGELHGELKDDKAAMNVLTEMLGMAEKSGRLDDRHSAYELMRDIYKRLGDKEKSAMYQEKMMQIEDSLYNQQSYNATKNKLFEYEAEQTRNEILTLNDRITRQWWVIVVFAVLIVVLVVLTIIIFRQKKSLSSAYRVLVEKNIESIKKNDAVDSRLLSDEQALLLLDRIREVMEQTEVISDNEFSLSSLAKLVDSNTKYVSWVINDKYHKNFKTYLNEYRVREASRMLTDQESYGHLTIQAISESVGYKSQASFIQAFKNVVGMTPSVYQKLAKESEA